jgi:hypothetical protein
MEAVPERNQARTEPRESNDLDLRKPLSVSVENQVPIVLLRDVLDGHEGRAAGRDQG